MPDTPGPDLDAETERALTLFNEYVVADRERARRERRVKKAERAKDDAAAAIKKLEEKGGSAEEKAAAETTYREALDMWKRLRDGEEPQSAPTPAGGEQATDAPAEEPPEPANDQSAEDGPPEDEPAET